MTKRALPGLCLVLALLFAAQVSQSYATGDPTPLAPDIEVAAEMAAMPTDCGILPDSVSPDPGISNAIGTFPIWVGITDGALPMPTEHYQDNPQLAGWWSTKLGWLIPKTYTGVVQLQGWNVADDSPIYFEFDHEAGAVTHATLDPDEPGGFVDGLEAWAFFPSYIWVSKAGCYRLHAEWEGGMWEQIIAVGGRE
jgi:hypothetical protein